MYSLRLPRQSLAHFQLLILVAETDVVSTGRRGCDHLKPYLGEVAPETSARAVAEGSESLLLALRDVLPALGPELVRVGPPDLLEVMDGICR